MAPLAIGALLFDDLDQLDLTGPFEVLSRLPGARFHFASETGQPVRDIQGLVLTATTTWSECPPLDILVVPGGDGVNRLMENTAALDFLRYRAAAARWVFSVCTGALLCGAAGLLRGRRATTHWGAREFLAAFGAEPSADRVVVDGTLVTAAGVTSGLDGALRLAALIADEAVAREIQLYLEYSPDPPFPGGTPDSAAPETVQSLREKRATLTADRAVIVARAAARLADGKPFPTDS
jgi:cyclohexyl-isocyanide hydratase